MGGCPPLHHIDFTDAANLKSLQLKQIIIFLFLSDFVSLLLRFVCFHLELFAFFKVGCPDNQPVWTLSWWVPNKKATAIDLGI